MSATAVTKSQQGNHFLAAKGCLYVKKDNTWKRSLQFKGRMIRELISCKGRIYGVGDGGLFVTSNDEGESWSVKQFPMRTSIWSIVANGMGLVITHGEKEIYLSKNGGKTWTSYYPFQFQNAPSVRSLSLYKNKLFIGTKIHSDHGGVWCFDLFDKSMTLVKRETCEMISSIITHNHQLIVATGSCRHAAGKVAFCKLSSSLHNLNWKTCRGNEEQSFLDLHESGGIIYSTSTQNKHGFSTISQVSLKNKEIVPFHHIKGHGWRIWNDGEDYIVAGLYESMEYTKMSHQALVM